MKRFSYAIYDNDCFNLHSFDNGLKRCGGKCDDQFVLTFLWKRIHFIEQKLKNRIIGKFWYISSNTCVLLKTLF